MTRALVYIAAPYRPLATSPWRATVERMTNMQRACLLGRLAAHEGLAPIVVHPMIESGVFGSDDNPEDRAAGCDADDAIIGTIARTTSGRLWVLLCDDRSLTTGVSRDVEAFRCASRGGEKGRVWDGTWADWRTLAERWGHGAEWDRLAPTTRRSADPPQPPRAA